VPRNVRHGSGDRDRGHARPGASGQAGAKEHAVDGTHHITQLIRLDVIDMTC
jgi:hypothetical protein